MAEPRGTERVMYQDDDGRTIGDVYQHDSHTLRPGVEYSSHAGNRYSFHHVDYGEGGKQPAVLYGYDSDGDTLLPLIPSQVKTVHRGKQVEPTQVEVDEFNTQARAEEESDDKRYQRAYSHARNEALQHLRDAHPDHWKRLLGHARRKFNAYRKTDERYRP